MVSFAKGIVAAIAGSVVLYLFSQFVYFFPWYMTMVVETFNLANMATVDNYVREMYYDSTFDKLSNAPIYNKAKDKIEIDVRNADGGEAVGDASVDGDDEYYYNSWDGETGKPYRQRGEPVVVTISAVYPLEMTLWGRTISRELPVSFSLTVVGTKYYKDLDDI